jgi:hypothetical protein
VVGYNGRMRLRWLVSGAVFVGLAILAVALYHRLRILPLEGPPRPKGAQILTVLNAKCDPGDLNYKRVFVVRPTPDRSTVQIDSENVPLQRLGADLTQIFRTRAERTVYVIQDADGDGKEPSPLTKMVAQIPVIDRVCVIDSKHPPAWYPPPSCCPRVPVPQQRASVRSAR